MSFSELSLTGQLRDTNNPGESRAPSQGTRRRYARRATPVSVTEPEQLDDRCRATSRPVSVRQRGLNRELQNDKEDSMTTERNYPSRHHRPSSPPPLVLQPRDRQLLQSVYRHRYLLAEHVRQLHFPKASLRVAQQRLRRLWEHCYLDRLFLPLSGNGRVTLSPPLYSLAIEGARVVGADLNIPPAHIPHTPRQNARGYATLLHHLVATDLLVAAECCNTENLRVVTMRETAMRQALVAARQSGRWRASAIIPDGALTLFPRGNVGGMTFYVEVVRASVKCGNALMAKKFCDYANLHHRGYFQTVFGHNRVRAILILTTSPKRAEHFRQMAAKLPYGRNLFWFGAYQPPRSGRLAVVPMWDHVRGREWQAVDKRSFSLAPDSGCS